MSKVTLLLGCRYRQVHLIRNGLMMSHRSVVLPKDQNVECQIISQMQSCMHRVSSLRIPSRPPTHTDSVLYKQCICISSAGKPMPNPREIMRTFMSPIYIMQRRILAHFQAPCSIWPPEPPSSSILAEEAGQSRLDWSGGAGNVSNSPKNGKDALTASPTPFF